MRHGAPSPGREDLRDRRGLRLGVLDDEDPARMQQLGRAPREDAHDVETVGAAVERRLGAPPPARTADSR